MSIPRRAAFSSRFLAAGALAVLLSLSLLGGAAASSSGGDPGKGHHKKHHKKVTICHKGKVTLRVSQRAAKWHIKHHGDTRGPCTKTAQLIVIKHVVNDNGGTKTAADFTLTINGVTASGGNSFAGSASGVTKTITSFGSYSVTESSVAGYRQTSASNDCEGTIAAGQHKTCAITNNDRPARLTVIKHVVNDSGGTKTAADFTLTINGVTAVGSNTFAGSESGKTKTLTSFGAYSVTEAAVAGYTMSSSADCSGTIALGEQKTCVIINNDVSP